MGFSKKGALVAYILIPMILALAGFIILLYFLGMLNFSNYAGDEVCKLSVLTRATTPAAAQNFVPLKCFTKKICLTKSFFGECKEFAGEKNVERVRLPDDFDAAARKIEEANANAKYDCWRMMGEGKLDLFGNFWGVLGLDSKMGQSTCVICSRIAIDKSSFTEKELGDILGQVDINNYMETHQVPGSELTYVQTFSNSGTSKLVVVQGGEDNDKKMKNGLNKIFDDNKGSIPDAQYIESNYGEKLKSGNLQRAYVFSQVKKEKLGDVFNNLGDIGVSIALGAGMTPVIGKAAFHPYVLIPGLVVAAGTAGYAAYNTYIGNEAAGEYCGKFQSSVVNNQEGCSLVQGVPYDVKYINSICKSMQGNP